MSSELGAWLRQQREDRGWTRSELARQLIKVARTRGDTSVPSADNISHNIYRWERGAVTPAERYQLYYCGAFGIPFSQFGVPAQPGTQPGSPGAAGRPALSGAPPGMVDPSLGQPPSSPTVSSRQPVRPRPPWARPRSGGRC